MVKNKWYLLLPEIVILTIVPYAIHSYDLKDLHFILEEINDFEDKACDEFDKYFCNFKFSSTNENALFSKRNVPEIDHTKWYHETKEMLTSKSYKMKNSDLHKRWFDACLYVGRSGRQGLKSVKEIIENFGSWPLFSNDDDSEIQVWPSISEAYGDLIGESVFFNIKRLKGKGSAILNISKPEDGVVLNYLQYIDEIKDSLGQELKKIIRYYQSSGTLYSGAIKKLEKFIELYLEILKNEETEFKVKSFEEIQAISDTYYENNNPEFTVNWTEIFKKTLIQAVEIESSTEVSIDTKYFQNLCGLLSGSVNSVVVNFLHWAFLFDRQLFSYWNPNYMEGFDESRREKQCIETMPFREEVLHNALTQSVHSKTGQLKKIFKNIISEFKSEISQSWLADHLKKEMISTIGKIKLNFKSVMKLNTTHPKFKVTGDLVKDWIASTRNRNFQFYKSGKTPEKIVRLNKYDDFVSHSKGVLTVDPQLFVLPMFISDASEALHYGSVGFILAESIAYSMTNDGFMELVKNSKNMNFAMIQRYFRRTDCLVKEFNKLGLNGDESLEKNLVFSLGIQLAYNAFKNFGKDYYPLRAQGEFYESKLFFLSFSHMFCPQYYEEDDYVEELKIRVNGILKNSKGFINTFQCTEKDKLFSNAPFDLLINKIIIKDEEEVEEEEEE